MTIAGDISPSIPYEQSRVALLTKRRRRGELMESHFFLYLPHKMQCMQGKLQSLAELGKSEKNQY